MAILAAVAVVGVSVYIPKSQKAADKQMIADIQQAVDLYAYMETVTPGQSGYIVIHKAAGTGETGNVSVGGTMDDFLTYALIATFGEKYGDDLKVSYGEWSGTFSTAEVEAINNSSFITNISGKSDSILETVEMLTGAMNSYYDSNGVGNAQYQANKTVLDVAKFTSDENFVNKEVFIRWWTTTDLAQPPLDGAFNFGDNMTTEEKLKYQMAAEYARDKAFVMYTGCPDCVEAFGTADDKPFDGITDPLDAAKKLADLVAATKSHILDNGGCSKCQTQYDKYTKGQGTAKSDAEAYLALMGEIASMESTLVNSDGFNQSGFYTSEVVSDIVGEYLSVINSYSDVSVQNGDIVVSFYVDQFGQIKFMTNISE